MKLEGVRVVDLSHFLPGPYLSMIMADHGADVIKVEPPGGDPGRDIGLREDGVSIFFRNLNRGKQSVTLDLKTADGRSSLLQLSKDADVFIEAFRPGVTSRLGCDEKTLRSHNPRLVYCSISAYGQTGPYAHRPAHDLAIEAMAGAVSLNLGQDGIPTNPHMPVADLTASLLALSAILMALYRRNTSGRGDSIDLSMHDATLASFPNVLGTTFALKSPPDCKSERTWGGAAFYRIYATRDGRHVALGAQETKFVRALLGAWERLDLIELCERGPGAHQQPVIDFFTAQFKTKTYAQWIEWFADRDIGFSPVQNLREAFDDPHARARGMRLLDTKGREHVGTPIKFADEPGRPTLRAPELKSL